MLIPYEFYLRHLCRHGQYAVKKRGFGSLVSPALSVTVVCLVSPALAVTVVCLVSPSTAFGCGVVEGVCVVAVVGVVVGIPASELYHSMYI